jgi:hypothetical protein
MGNGRRGEAGDIEEGSAGSEERGAGKIRGGNGSLLLNQKNRRKAAIWRIS